MDLKKEGTLEIAVALLVLFSAMWDPRISVAFAVIALAALGVYKLVRKEP